MTTRADVVACARTWLGTRFHHRERQKGLGVDCAGLIIGVARELALVAPDFDIPPYRSMPDGRTLLLWCDQHMDRIERDAMAPGDVVVLVPDERPQHMGFLGDYRHGGLSLIHAATTHPSGSVGWTVETRLMFSRNLRFVAAYSLRGLEG